MALEIEEQGGRRVVRIYDGPHFVTYAGFVSRAMAAVIDLLIIFSSWLTGGVISWFFNQTSGITQLINWLVGYLPWLRSVEQFLASSAFSIIVLLVIGQLYFTFFYAFGGASVGKYVMGLRVVRSDGRPLNGAQAALRTAAYAASALPLYVGFVNVLLDDRRRAWHDKLTGTVVVHSWRARPDETFLRQAIERLEKRS